MYNTGHPKYIFNISFLSMPAHYLHSTQQDNSHPVSHVLYVIYLKKVEKIR